MPLFYPPRLPRTGVVLIGTIDGVNMVFTTPDFFLNDGTTSILVYYNGVRLELGAGNDYTLSESGGPGTGFDTVTLPFAPVPPKDKITADYFVS